MRMRARACACVCVFLCLWYVCVCVCVCGWVGGGHPPWKNKYCRQIVEKANFVGKSRNMRPQKLKRMRVLFICRQNKNSHKTIGIFHTQFICRQMRLFFHCQVPVKYWNFS